jgi:hypothetical protein
MREVKRWGIKIKIKTPPGGGFFSLKLDKISILV